MTTVPVGDAKERLEERIDAARRGEEVVIASGDGADVRLMPVVDPALRPRQAGSMHGMIHMGDDFDDPIPGFEPTM